MSEDKIKILEFAFDKFISAGIQKTTMDEIAKEMRISKKTIYKHFNSKNVLLNATISYKTENLRSSIVEIVSSNLNAIEKITRLGSIILTLSMKFTDRWFTDLKIHFPGMWSKIEEFRQKTIADNFTKIIDQGIAEGYFVDRPTDILLTILRSSIQSVINPEFIINHKYTAHEAAEITLDIIFSGIFTKKGRRLYKQIKSEKIL